MVCLLMCCLLSMVAATMGKHIESLDLDFPPLRLFRAVVDEQGKLVGLISRANIVKVVLECLRQESGAVERV